MIDSPNTSSFLLFVREQPETKMTYVLQIYWLTNDHNTCTSLNPFPIIFHQFIYRISSIRNKREKKKCALSWSPSSFVYVCTLYNQHHNTHSHRPSTNENHSSTTVDSSSNHLHIWDATPTHTRLTNQYAQNNVYKYDRHVM